MTHCHLSMHLSHWRPTELSELEDSFARPQALALRSAVSSQLPGETLASRATAKADGAAAGHAPRGPVTS